MTDISYDINALSDNYIAWQIGEFVRHHRMKQNRTQDAFAKDAGVDRAIEDAINKTFTI